MHDNANCLKWVPLAGKWSFEGETETYNEPEDPGTPYGLALFPQPLRQGTGKVRARLHEPREGAARVVFGFDPLTQNYYSAGIGGYSRAYVVDEFLAGRGWSALALQGSRADLRSDEDISFEVEIRGQRARLAVESVPVIEKNLPHPLTGDQVGIFTWGPAQVAFSAFSADPLAPRAFVIMEFSEAFNSFFEHVVQPAAKKLGLDAFRASDVYKPGAILADILRDIVESEVIIAEITSANPNVFYALGHAHAMGKQTILLADRATARLPFDISGYRVIFYDNSIPGKPEVERQLHEHLKSIMAETGRTAAP